MTAETSLFWSGTIPMVLPAKGNNHVTRWIDGTAQIRNNKKTAHAINQATMLFRSQAPEAPFKADDLLSIQVWMRYKDWRADVTIEYVKDVLQHAGIVPNDHQIWRHVYEPLPETGEPWTYVQLTRIGVVPWKVKG